MEAAPAHPFSKRDLPQLWRVNQIDCKVKPKLAKYASVVKILKTQQYLAETVVG